MNNKDFWESIHTIIAEGFTPEGLQKLDYYAEQFINGRLVYQRFSQQKVRQIERLHKESVISKEKSNRERSRLHA